MDKAFMFVGVAGFTVALTELLPEGNWLYLGLLVISTSLMAFAATDKETSK